MNGSAFIRHHSVRGAFGVAESFHRACRSPRNIRPGYLPSGGTTRLANYSSLVPPLPALPLPVALVLPVVALLAAASFLSTLSFLSLLSVFSVFSVLPRLV